MVKNECKCQRPYFQTPKKVPQEQFLAPSTFQCTFREHCLVTTFFEIGEKLIQILIAWSIISNLAFHGAIALLHQFNSYSTGSTGSKKCCSREQRFYYKQGFHCSQLNRNKNHVINLLLHEELSWRLLTKLPESISTFQLPQKMWSQASVP